MSDELEIIDEGIWAATGQAKMMPGVYLPIQATVLRLNDGSLMVHNPIDFTNEQAAAIGKLGEVSTIFAPNLYHNLFLAGAQQRFSDARLIGVRDFDKKIKSVNFETLVDGQLPGNLQEEFAHVFIEGAPTFNEVVLCHRRTKSLLVADYFFNVTETKGWLTPFVMGMTQSLGAPKQSKLWRWSTKNKAAMKESAEKVLNLDYRRVIMCHGHRVEDGREFTRESLGWLVDA